MRKLLFVTAACLIVIGCGSNINEANKIEITYRVLNGDDTYTYTFRNNLDAFDSRITTSKRFSVGDSISIVIAKESK